MTLFQPHKVLSPAGVITESSKGHSIILLGQLFQDEGNIMTLEKCMRLRPMLHFTCYKIVFCLFYFFVRSNVVWITVKMSMAFCKPTDGDLSRNTRVGKAKPCLFQWEQRATPSMMGVIQCNKLATRCLASSPGNGHFRAQCWSLLLAGWVLSNDLSQIGLDE